MFKTFNMDTVEDARALVARYELEKFPWGNYGTADGFAKLLFEQGGDVSLNFLSKVLRGYRAECKKRGTEFVNAEIDADSDPTEAVLSNRAAERKLAADFIRKLKQESEGNTWRQVAQLATTGARSTVIASMGATQCASVWQVLNEIWKLQHIFFDSVHGPDDYHPGKDATMDHCIRVDIERLDETLLKDKPWNGSEDDVYEEAVALFTLMRSNVWKELEAVLKQAGIEVVRVDPSKVKVLGGVSDKAALEAT